MGTFLIYGANGYTGALIAREAVRRGHRPILAGRNAETVAALAHELGLEHRAFSLDDPAAVEQGLRDCAAVVHCAGPFAHTWKAMTDACLRSGTHYLDINGDIGVFESIAARDAEAKAAGVMLLPGAGFDVVPSDCLAAHLKRRLPTATRLVLAFRSTAGISRGTATTMLENVHRGGCVRRGGVLTRVTAAWKTRAFDFGTGPLEAITTPWGDVATAYHSTGIPDIEVYAVVPRRVRVAARLTRYFGWLLRSAGMQAYLRRRIQAGPPGPSDEARARGKSYIWGEVSDEAGNRAATRLHGPEGYTFTVLAALTIVERVLAGHAPTGFQTPSTAFGPDFALQLKGVVREDCPVQ